MKVLLRLLSAVSPLLLVVTPAHAESAWEVSANIDLQTRLFLQEPRWPGQDNSAADAALTATVEFRWRSESGAQRAAIIPTARFDPNDEERSLFDLQEAYWAFEGDDIEILVGANTVFWGVTESVHLVDIINQTDLAADIDGEDKLGQPMLNLELQRDWGRLGLFVMPLFRERTFAGIDGRLRTPLAVNTDDPVYESSAEDTHVDIALRYSHYIGDVDIGLSLFSGTSREPRLLPGLTGETLAPFYDQINQVGLDLQYTTDAWLWKLEAIVRDGFDDRFAAAVAGFEYTRYQLFDSSADLGWLLEYQYDGRADSEPLVITDDDVFAGARLALNDIADTAVLAGAVVDVNSGETFINIEAERRFGDNYFVELRARLLTGADVPDPTFAFERDDYLQLQVSRYF